MDDISKLRLQIAILLNITPDHLDRYEYSLELYANAKMRIAENSLNTDYFIYNADDEVVAEAMKRKPTKAKKIPFSLNTAFEEGAYIKNEQIIINTNHLICQYMI